MQETRLLQHAVQQKLLSTILLIHQYYEWRKENGKDRRCFTYQGLLSWMQRSGKLKHSHWHTVERKIRRLAEGGFLTRVPRGKIMIFCPTNKFWMVIEQHRRMSGWWKP